MSDPKGAPPANSSSPSRSTPTRPFAALKLDALKSNLDEFLMSSVLNNSPLGSTAPTKEPLSLQTTSNNFRRFVQKAGPIFLVQDAAEAVFRWDDTSRTLFFGAAFAFLCLYPSFLFILPNVLIATILLSSHGSRPVRSPPSSPLDGPKPYTLPALPPQEDSVDYLANLQNIQIMMGNIAKLTDLGRSLVPYLTWRDERTSLVLLQVTVVSGLLLAFISPYIPWRYVFLVSGETILLVGHPVVQKLVREAAPIVLSKSKRWSVRVERLVEEDALPDDELEGEIDIVERYDVESRTPDGQWVQDTVVGGELPEDSAGGRWRWIQRGDWQVDAVAEWAEGKVDDAGYAYLGIEGTKSATPKGSGSQTRRRRLTRRAVKLPV